MAERLQVTTGRCYKCGRVRQTVGTPPACVACIRHYQKNLMKRENRQKAKEGGEGLDAAAIHRLIVEKLGNAPPFDPNEPEGDQFGESFVSRTAPIVARGLAVEQFAKSRLLGDEEMSKDADIT